MTVVTVFDPKYANPRYRRLQKHVDLTRKRVQAIVLLQEALVNPDDFQVLFDEGARLMRRASDEVRILPETTPTTTDDVFNLGA
jgi:CRISPR/Cas system-associated endoribonuclease Cas2